MSSRHLALVVSLAASSLCLGGLALAVGCSGDDEPTSSEADGGAADADGATTTGLDADGGGTVGDGSAAPGDGGSGGSTVPLIPTDGGAYFVAAIAGEPMTLQFNLTAARSAGGFATIRGSKGLTLPTRDLEIRVPAKQGTSACAGASLVLRTSDMGALVTGEPGTSCTFDVTTLSGGAGQRVKGTFRGVVKATDGKTVEINDGAFDVPTLN